MFVKKLNKTIMKKIFNITNFIIIALAAIMFTSCDSNDNDMPTTTDNSITGIALSTPDLSILVQALTKTNLASTLQGTGRRQHGRLGGANRSTV